ncbi:hypothetical protein IPA_03850 [Ignicoccus pacificus DSM 13166]|uniref:Archaeal PaREP1/PaREP8 family n=1 Tax=Ignicoccus pacificus DSM 13166 TaxID=940294 RepID=A0A977K9C5_9CREN|nr:hypothetical protein IPA_03850 [Ignicoccus pacificus DSM 13166]
MSLLEELQRKANEESKYPNDQEFLERKAIDVVYEMLKAKELLEKGDTRNAAGKAFQAWKDLLSCLVYLNLDKLAKDEKEKEWYLKKGIIVPTTKMQPLALKLEELGFKGISSWSDKALLLHNYQYNGPDPDNYYGGIVSEEVAKEYVKLLLKATKEYLEKYVLPHIKGKSLEMIREGMRLV